MQTLVTQAPLLTLAAVLVLIVLVVWLILAIRGHVDALRQDASTLQHLMRDLQDNYAHTMDTTGNLSASASRLSKEIQSALAELSKLNAALLENRARLHTLRKEADTVFQTPEVRDLLEVSRE
ncbi:MAG TPA: hypothetical protein VFA81_12260 [Burkholderiales bacterium]|nr:hypothetical protein [Burkholderiales bacterium]